MPVKTRLRRAAFGTEHAKTNATKRRFTGRVADKVKGFFVELFHYLFETGLSRFPCPINNLGIIPTDCPLCSNPEHSTIACTSKSPLYRIFFQHQFSSQTLQIVRLRQVSHRVLQSSRLNKLTGHLYTSTTGASFCSPHATALI